jgi:hypothetical protein
MAYRPLLTDLDGPNDRGAEVGLADYAIPSERIARPRSPLVIPADG